MSPKNDQVQSWNLEGHKALSTLYRSFLRPFQIKGHNLLLLLKTFSFTISDSIK